MDTSYTLYFTWDSSNLYFGLQGLDFDSGGQNALYINIDENPGIDDGYSDGHYDVSWSGGSMSSNNMKYDYVTLVGNIENGSNDYTGIKWGDYTSGSWSWTNNQLGSWSSWVENDGTDDLTELRIPRDIDSSGSIDSDEISSDQDDSACFTFALVNTANSWVFASHPDEDSDSDVDFAHCYLWDEINADVNDVWDEAVSTDSIPEFPSIFLPILSIIAIFSFNNYKSRSKK